LNGSGHWRAWMCEEARRELERAASASHPNETGGILVGVHTGGARPWIVHAVEIPSSNSGSAHYVVPPGRRRKAVEGLRKQHDPRLGYLGEWHSHPLNVGPSPTDLDSIRQIASDRSAGCARPVLLVARRSGDAYLLDALQVDRHSLRLLTLIAAGPLPSTDTPPQHRRPRRRIRTTVSRR
jgi:hypothetical protein